MKLFGKQPPPKSRPPMTDGIIPAQNVVDLRPKPKKAQYGWNWPLIIGVFAVLLVIAAVALGLIFWHHKPAYKPNTLTTVGNLNYVTDDPQGIKFAITKDFT